MSSDGLLRDGTTTIPATASGTVGSPVGSGAGAWTGTGFGFTVASGTNLGAGWSSGTKWAAVPSSSTTVHSTGAAFTAGQNISSTMRVNYRLTVPAGQAPGSYSTIVTYTVTASP